MQIRQSPVIHFLFKNPVFGAVCGPKEGRWNKTAQPIGGYTRNFLLGRGVLGDGLGSFRDGVLGQFSGKDQTDSSLDFSGRDGGTLVVVSETAGFSGNAFEDVIDEGVHDGHGLGRDT